MVRRITGRAMEDTTVAVVGATSTRHSIEGTTAGITISSSIKGREATNRTASMARTGTAHGREEVGRPKPSVTLQAHC